MTFSISNIKTGGRAIAVAVGLASAVTMLPTAAYAQPDIQFRRGGVEFGFGTGGFTIGISCLSRNEIRRGLRDADFEDIDFRRFTSRRAVVRATWEENDRRYEIDINRCSGEVTDIDRVRGRDDDDD